MNRARPAALPLALFAALAAAAPSDAAAQPGTPGHGSAAGGEPGTAPGSTAETVSEPEPVTTGTSGTGASGTTAPPAAAASPTPAPATAAPIAPDPEAEAPAEEDERTRLFYIEAGVGYTWIDLGQFRLDNLVPSVVRIDGNGFAAAAGGGLQVSFLTFGLQGEWARYPDFDLGTVALSLGVRLPVPLIQPYFRAGVGYAWVLNVDDGVSDAVFPTGLEGVRGLAADAAIGVDIAITEVFAINLGFDAAVLSLKRQQSGIDDFGDPNFVPNQDGDAVGLQLSLLAGVNLRF